jgi:hypothetical protein
MKEGCGRLTYWGKWAERLGTFATQTGGRGPSTPTREPGPRPADAPKAEGCRAITLNVSLRILVRRMPARGNCNRFYNSTVVAVSAIPTKGRLVAVSMYGERQICRIER